MKIAVVIPAYNEATRISPVLQNMPRVIDGHTVLTIVVDDGSKDGTAETAKQVDGIQVLHHRTNLGKGAAAKTGCDAAYALGVDIIVLCDADGQHKPEDLPRLLVPLLDSPSTGLVLGSRQFSREMPRMMRVGNHFFSLAGRTLFGIQARDTQSGYRAFRRDIYPQIRWLSPHYAMETEMLILAALRGVSYTEVEIETIYYNHYKGTTVLDGFRVLRTMLKWKLPWYQESSLLESSLL